MTDKLTTIIEDGQRYGVPVQDEDRPMRNRPPFGGKLEEHSYNVTQAEAVERIQNPSCVLGEDVDTFYYLGWTPQGAVRGPVKRTRELALAAYNEACKATVVP